MDPEERFEHFKWATLHKNLTAKETIFAFVKDEIINELENILGNSHGGGTFRKNIMWRIEELKKNYDTRRKI